MAGRVGGGGFRSHAGRALASIGVFMLVTGVMLVAYVYNRVAVIPKNTYVVTTLQASNATYFDPSLLMTRTGLDVTATSTLRGNVAASHGNVAVFDTFLAVQVSDGTPVEYVGTRVAVDRHTGQLVNCCGANIGGRPIQESGYSFKFPFFVKKTTYPVFDPDVAHIVPAVYAGQQTLDGMRTYKYVQSLPPTQILTQQVPPSIMGLPTPKKPTEITVRDIETTTMTFWIDPVIGAPMKVEQNTRQVFQTLDGQHSLVVFAADLNQIPSQVASNVRKDKSLAFQLNLVHRVLPPFDLIGGPVLIVVGLAILLIRRRPEPAYPAMEPDQAAPYEAAQHDPAAPYEAVGPDPAAHHEEESTEAQLPRRTP